MSQADFMKASLLLSQSRYDLAERELRGLIADDPQDPTLRQMLARALAGQEKYEAALAEAQESVRLAPDDNDGYFALGSALVDLGRFKEAAVAAERAVELSPYDPHNWGLLAAVRRQQGRWAECLEAAERGLAAEPEHAMCANLRSSALTHLGRAGEAQSSLAEVLARDPEDEVAHCNLGWELLHRGDAERAAVHFREALRLDPSYEWARLGLLEALKSRHRLYATVLRAFLWLASRPAWVQWAILGGYIVGTRVLKAGLTSAGPYGVAAYRVASFGLMVAWLLIVTARPLFNLVLRFSREGRGALSDAQRSASNVHAGLLVVMVAALAAWPWIGVLGALLIAAVAAFLMGPVTDACRCPPGRARRTMWAYVAAMALLGLTLIASRTLPLLVAVALTLGKGAALLLVRNTIPLLLAFLVATFFSDNIADALIARERRRNADRG